MIFSRRWYGIKGETIGEGKYAMSVVRVQTTKDGAWQALTDAELDQLLIEHNKNVDSRDRDRGVVHHPPHPNEKESFKPPKKAKKPSPATKKKKAKKK